LARKCTMLEGWVAQAASEGMDWLAHTSVLRMGPPLTCRSRFFSVTDLILTVQYKPPRVKPTRGAPSDFNQRDVTAGSQTLSTDGLQAGFGLVN
jgi:hypothetical protein